MKEIRLENTVVWKAQTGGRKSPNWRKEEKQLHSRTRCTCARLVNEKVRDHVLSRPILCVVVHFQLKFLPQSAMEEKFPGYRPFVLPTHFHKWVGEPDYGNGQWAMAQQGSTPSDVSPARNDQGGELSEKMLLRGDKIRERQQSTISHGDKKPLLFGSCSHQVPCGSEPTWCLAEPQPAWTT